MRGMMKITRNILTLALLSAGLSYAGVYEKTVVTPEPLCGPWYMSAFGGGSFFDDGDFVSTAGDRNATFGFDNGWIVGGAVGLRTANDWRFEVEGSHSQAPGDNALFNFTDVVPVVGGPAVLVDSVGAGVLHGDVERTSVMFNVAKEFAGLTFWNLRPYLGAGVGLTSVRTDLRSTTAQSIPAALGGGTAFVDNHFYGDEVVLGYQAMAGLVLDITECLQVYLEYRLTGHGDPEDVSVETSALDLDGDGAADFGGDIGDFGDLDLGWAQHAIIGMRLFF